MKTTILVCATVALSVVVAQSAVVTVEVAAGPALVDETAVDLDADGTTDFSIRGNQIFCTTDHPTSACVRSVAIRGREGVEYLYGSSDGGIARPLVAGEVLAAGSSGIWAAAPFDTVTVSYFTNMLDPTRSGYGNDLDGREVYAFAFRQDVGGGGYRYGWIDVALAGSLLAPQATAIRFGDSPDATVTYSPVPEPGPLLLLAAGSAALAFGRNRRPTTTGCVADFRDRRRGSD